MSSTDTRSRDPRGAEDPRHLPDGNRPHQGGAGLTRTFSAFRIPAFRYLWASSICSFGGMQMQMFARGLLAYELGGTAGAIGVVGVGFAFPQLVFSLIGGTVADRFERRKLLILTQAGTAALAVAIAVLVYRDAMTIPLLVVFGLVQGTIFSFGGPARQAFVPEVVGENDIMNAIALNQAGMNLTRIGGPSIAGLLVALPFIDLHGLYLVQAILNTLGLTTLFFLPQLSKGGMKAADREPAAELRGQASARQKRGRGSMRKELLLGLSYIKGSPILLTLLLMGLVPTFVGLPYQNYLPVFAQDVFGDGLHRNAAALGLMGTMSGVGALVGSLTVASLSDYPRRTKLQLGAGLGFGLFLSLFALQHSLALALACLVGIGFMSSFFQSLNSTMVMSASDPDYYGRVMSVNMMTFSLMPLGSLPMGFIADAIGTVSILGLELIGMQVVLMACGLVIAAFILAVTLMNPTYGRLEQDDLKHYARVASDRMTTRTATPEPVAGG